MQGERTTESVIAALDRIYEYETVFDVVVIIRGGGSQTDLGCFDSYDMAANIAQFPLPVISGIGHERDETIVDRVSYMRVKTPTAAAAFLIEVFREQEDKLDTLQQDFVTGIQELLHIQTRRQLVAVSEFKRLVQVLLTERTTRLKLMSQCIEHASGLYIRDALSGFDRMTGKIENRLDLLWDRQQNLLEMKSRELRQKIERIWEENRRRLDLAETTMRLADPRKVLERGYSITRLNGKALKEIGELQPGDLLETEVAHGKIKSKVVNQ